MSFTPIHSIQGSGLLSPLSGQSVTTRGVVTGQTRRGYFIQDPDGDIHDVVSQGIFVYERRNKPSVGALVEVTGKAIDFLLDEDGRPTTQIEERNTRVLSEDGPSIEPVWLDAAIVNRSRAELTTILNSLEGMLVGVPANSTFVAPSNPFGDYVVLPPDTRAERTKQGGVLIDPEDPDRWLPSFRVTDYRNAPQVNVGARLLDAVVGPLNFRVASYQIAARGPIRVTSADVEQHATRLRGSGSAVTVLTLNGFNLDAHVERASHVSDPGRDIDDDVRDGRFKELAQAIVKEAGCPDIVALQEIQDGDGAEITNRVSAQRTLKHLIRDVERAGGPSYAWADIPPAVGADGGQPGGNIRNAFLYEPTRVTLVDGSLERLGDDSEAFVDSRKPLVARFSVVGHPGELEVINLHLASKRHQRGLFAPEEPGVDPRLGVRVSQAALIDDRMAQLRKDNIDYYVTGDFNDFEFSETLRALTGDHSTNLVDGVPAPKRFDYNHRGMSQALMHGVVANRQLDGRAVEYDILHGNALLGAQPGKKGEKASDHAYVIARLELAGPSGK